jgi:hydrogen peroxide-dependent heme synthase
MSDRSVASPKPLVPRRGWNVAHLFCVGDEGVDRSLVALAVKLANSDGLQVVCVSIIGARADACFLALGEDLWSIRRFQSGLQRAGFVISASYVSVTEVSEYAAGMPEAMINARLYPTLPPEGLAAFCFYPMSKRRGDQHNWYGLAYEERDRLMRQHGAVGREFKGRILQLVTGSTGLDDYEWGVTLFGAHPDDLQECVYQMRFDEASTLYAEFGPFYTGAVGTLDEVLALSLGDG